MEPGTVHQETDENASIGRAAKAVLLMIMRACLVCLLFAAAAFSAEERERIIEYSGIRYPDGYDAQTVGEVRGKAYDLYRPNKGPVSFDLRTKFETYRVIASPPWYWEDLHVELPDGGSTRVIGSKSLGNDGKLYIVAQEIYLPSGKSVVLRDKDGAALWKGGARGGSEGGSGWGSSSRGRGGIGGGFGGGAGRGRR